MKKVVIAVVAIFVVTLAVMVGKRMSADAMAVVVGIVCGIGASIPTSLLMIYLVGRRSEKEDAARQQPQVPSVMIVNPAGGGLQPYYPQPGNQYLPPVNAYGQRRFEILGAEDYDERGGRVL